jgi:hypothetical protein
LSELSEQRFFQLGDKGTAAAATEVKHRHDNDLIKIESRRTLPDALQGEVALLCRQTPESAHELLFDAVELLVEKRPTGIVRQGQIEIVTMGPLAICFFRSDTIGGRDDLERQFLTA